MFIETSKDLLYVVLAFCILWITVFVSWLLYYFIMIVRDTKALVGQVRGAVDKIEELTKAAHDKMERSAASFTLVAQAVKELITWGIQQKMKSSTRKRSAAAKKKK